MLVRRVWPYGGFWSDGFRELERAREEMDRLFDTLSDASGGPVWSGVTPLLNVTQDDERYYIRAAIPGVRPNDLSISALGSRVTLSGKRESLVPESGASFHRQERGEVRFSRAIELPTEADASRAEAHYADGIVTITLPRAESARPRQVPVKAG